MLCSQKCCALSLELHHSIPKVHADASCHSASDILRTLTCAGAGTPENKGDRKRMRPALLKTCTLDTHTPPAASHADVEMQYVKPSLHLPQHAVDLCKLCAIREQFCCSICKHQAVCTSSWTYGILRLPVCQQAFTALVQPMSTAADVECPDCIWTNISTSSCKL